MVRILVVPIVGGHVVVVHVPQFVDVRYGKVLTRVRLRIGHGPPIDVPVAAIRRIPLGRLVEGRVVGPHRVRPARISPRRFDAMRSTVGVSVNLNVVRCAVSENTRQYNIYEV